MSSRSISDVDKDSLLRNADIPDMKLNDITIHIQGHIQQTGFPKKAMFITGSDEYNWAHNTAPGIIWLWSQQDDDTRAQWLSNPKGQWDNFEPSPSPPYSPIPFGASESQVNPLDYSTPGTGAVSVPASSATAPPFSLGPSSSSIPPTAANPFSFGLSPVSVPTTPTQQASSTPIGPPSPLGSGGYRKRRTRKTRRKSNRRGKSRSRSRSRQIRRKKTHHRRHRR